MVSGTSVLVRSGRQPVFEQRDRFVDVLVERLTEIGAVGGASSD